MSYELWVSWDFRLDNSYESVEKRILGEEFPLYSFFFLSYQLPWILKHFYLPMRNHINITLYIIRYIEDLTIMISLIFILIL
jgi:hypothetical protein